MNRKVMLSLLTIVFLSVATIVGLILVGREQELRKFAQEPTGNQSTNCKADIMLVIDRSSTMNSKEPDGRTKLAWAIDGAKTFVNVLSAKPQITSRIGLASFGAQGNDGTGKLTSEYNSALNLSLNTSPNTVLGALNNLKHIKPGTCIECGLKIGNTAIASSNVHKYLVLLSDGIANHTWDGTSSNSLGVQKAKSEAASGRNSGVTYFVIGYGSVDSKANEPVLKDMAGDTSRYYFTPSATDWNNIFGQIANRICVDVTPLPSPSESPTAIPSASQSPSPLATSSPSATNPASVIIPITARCLNISAYDTSWNALSAEGLKKLQKGDTVRFAVSGSVNAGNIGKARFSFNGASPIETTTKRDNPLEYYVDFVITEVGVPINVNAEIHHSILGWF